MLMQYCLAAALATRLASLVTAVQQQHLPGPDICIATITVTSVANGGSSAPSSNPDGDPVTVTIVTTIAVTKTAYASEFPAAIPLTAATTSPSDPEYPVKTVTFVETMTITKTAFASSALASAQGQQQQVLTVTSLTVSTATVTSTVIQPITVIQSTTTVDILLSAAAILPMPTLDTDPHSILPSSTRAPFNNGTGSNLFNSTSAFNSTSSHRPLAGIGTSRPTQATRVPNVLRLSPSSSVTSSGTNDGSRTSSGSMGHFTTNSSSSGYESSLYFANWAIYGANFQPQSLPVSQVTRINYAFADIDDSTGEVKSSDTYADLEKHYPSDSWNDNGTNAYGCVKQLYLLKKANRNLKVFLAIGGWTYSSKFSPVAATAQLRATFAASTVKLVTDWGFDGVDIDWEFNAYTPAAGDAQNIILLLQAIRNAFDTWAAANANGYHFLISVAGPAGPATYGLWDMAAMDPYIDTWNLMAYDYTGAWSNASGHQANLYYNAQNPDITPYSTDQAVSAYVASGIAHNKILLGLPLYGRSFEDTAGLGLPFSGVGDGDDLGHGQWRLKDLPRSGATEFFDAVAGASYSYDAGAQEIISYDTPQSAQAKSLYLKQKNLGGAMFWEASTDRNGTESLVGIMSSLLGALKSTQNLLSYPTSQYNNIRDMMENS